MKGSALAHRGSPRAAPDAGGESSSRPRICIVSTAGPSAPGGLSAATRGLIGALRSSCEISTIARFASEPPDGVDYVATEEPRRLTVDGVPLTIISRHAHFAPALAQVQRLLAHRSLDPLGVRIFSRAYAASLRAAIPADVDLLHFVGAGWELLGHTVGAEARRRGVPFTVWPAVHPGTWGDSGLDVRLYRQADAVFALSSYESDHLSSLGVSGDRIIVTGATAETPRQGDGDAFRRRHGLSTEPLVLFIGRRQRYKGYHALRAAFEDVLQSVPEARLVSIGGEDEPPFPPVPESALLDLGSCDEQEKADALAACDMLCMPSTGESFGLVYLEAWRNGKAVIGGPAPAVLELIDDGVDGLHVDQSEPAIASAITRLLCDKALRDRLGAAGRRKAERFTPAAVGARHLAVFRALSGAARP